MKHVGKHGKTRQQNEFFNRRFSMLVPKYKGDTSRAAYRPLENGKREPPKIIGILQKF
jgi:hypothetical protein